MKGLSGEAISKNGRITLNSLERYLATNVPVEVKKTKGQVQTPWMERSGSNIDNWSLAEGHGPSLEKTKSRVSGNTRSVNDNTPAQADTGTSTPSKVTHEAFLSYYDRGTGFMQKGDNNHALEEFTRALSLKPDSFEAYANRGCIYYSKGDYDRSIVDYTKALSLNPGAYDTYTNRGLSYYVKGGHDRALDDFNKGLSMKPYFDYQIYYLRADIYRKKGMKEKAREDLKRVLDYAPKNAETVIENARKMLNLLDIP